MSRRSWSGTASAVSSSRCTPRKQQVRGVVNVDQSLQLGGFATALQSLASQLRGPDFTAAFDAVIASLGLDALNDDDRAWAAAKHRAARQDVVVGVWSTVLDSTPDELMATVESVLPAVDAPYLAVHGSPTPPDYAAWLANLVPRATVEVWDGDGHYPHLVEPERFAARVRAFSAT